MAHFLSYENAQEAVRHVVGLLKTEGYMTEYLDIAVFGDKKGYFIESSSEKDPKMGSRFRHLLRGDVKTMRNHITV